jgi:RNA polymerase sigma-70 factor (ECF subfamily)
MTANPRSSAALDAEALLTHGAWLAALARALVARDDEIDDIVQQTWLRTLERPPVHAGNVKGWLGAVARNVVRSRARNDTARVAREAIVPPPPPVETPHEAVERAELRRLVVEAVLALAEPYRSAVILRFFEERDVADVARLTSTGEETVRTRLRRGVEQVRRMLERKVVEGTGDAAHEGVAARALLFARLRDIAASGGGGGAASGTAASHGLLRAGRMRAARLPTKAIAIGTAAAVIVGAGGAAWWGAREGEREPASGAIVATADGGEVPRLEPPPPHEPPPEIAADRTRDSAGSSTPVATAPDIDPALSREGAIRGIVKGFDGAPVHEARVWAIAAPAHVPAATFPSFALDAREQAQADPTQPPPFTWIERRSDAEGRFDFDALSLLSGWTIGAYHPSIGAGLSELVELTRADREADVEVHLVRGARIRGKTTDASGAPVGGVTITLYTRDRRESGEGSGAWRNVTISEPMGEQIGEFDFEYQCSDLFSFSWSLPSFETSRKFRIDLADGATGVVLPIRLKRAPGVLARGAIVDSAAKPFDVGALLAERFPLTPRHQRWQRASIWAIEAGTASPDVLLTGMTAPGVVEGRIDFAANAYEVALPASFKGTLELRIYRTTVASIELADPRRPPDLVADPAVVPEYDRLTTFTCRFVDEATGSPIDLRSCASRLLLLDGGAPVELVESGSDLERGLVQQRCPAAPLALVAGFPGYATRRFEVVVPREPALAPTIFVVAPAVARLRGVVLSADGSPCADARLELLRASPEGWLDVTPGPTATNGHGEFEIEAVAGGDHAVVVAARAGEGPGIARFVATAPSVATEVRVTTGRPVGLRLSWPSNAIGWEPATTIEVRDRDGLPVARFDNTSYGSGRPVSVETTSFRLDDGRYSLHVSSWGFRDVHLEFDVLRELLEIELEPGETR